MLLNTFFFSEFSHKILFCYLFLNFLIPISAGYCWVLRGTLGYFGVLWGTVGYYGSTVGYTVATAGNWRYCGVLGGTGGSWE